MADQNTMPESTVSPELLALSQRWGGDAAAATADQNIINLFLSVLKRSPSPEELRMFSTFDPSMSYQMLKDMKITEDEAKNARIEPFLGAANNWLIKFTDDPTPGEEATSSGTYWLYSTNAHNLGGQNYSGMLIPFSSEAAIKNFLGDKLTLEQARAQNQIIQIPVSSLKDPNSDFYNARLVKYNDGIREDGRMSDIESIRWRYGQEINRAHELRAISLLSSTFENITKNDPNFTQKYYDNAFRNDLNKSKYIGAIAYGGYTVPDIYMDIMAHNKRVEGDPLFSNYKGIDTMRNRNDWKMESADYKLLTSPNTPLSLPKDVPNLNWTDLNYSLWDMPQTALDFYTSPQAIDYKDKETMDKIMEYQAFAEDIAVQMSEADNRRDLAAAQYNWDQLRQDIKDNLGYELSDNAFSAWNQLETLKSNMAERGVVNTGIHHKAMDMMTRDRQRSNQRFREASKKQEDSELRDYLLNNPGDAKAFDDFIDKHGEDTAREWGILPDEETMAFFTLDNMRELFPDVSDEEIQHEIDMMLTTTPNGRVVNTPVAWRNNKSYIWSLKENALRAKTEKFYQDEELRAAKAAKDFESGSLFAGDSGYKEGSGEQTPAVDPRTQLYPGFEPYKYSGWETVERDVIGPERAAGRNPEAVIARTSGANVYKRDEEAERAMIGYYRDILSGGRVPQTEADWNKFRDFVYEGPQQRVQTQEFPTSNQYLSSASEAAKNISNQQTQPTGTKDFGASSSTGAPSSTGFQPAPSDSRFWGINPESEENLRRQQAG